MVSLHIGTGFGFASHGVPVRFRCDLKFSNKDFKSSFDSAGFSYLSRRRGYEPYESGYSLGYEFVFFLSYSVAINGVAASAYA